MSTTPARQRRQDAKADPGRAKRLNWNGITSEISECQDCVTSKQDVTVLPWDDSLTLPDPLSRVERVRLLMISWSPPGGNEAIQRRHFFYNAASKDRLRPKLFTAFSRAGFENLKQDGALEQLDRFLSQGFYLTPTVFRRCSKGGKDKPPPLDLRMHSYRKHVLKIVQYCKPMNVVLLGKAPLETMLRANPEYLPELQVFYRECGRLRDCRVLAIARSYPFDQNAPENGFLHISYWPRGRGIDLLAGDVLRILGQ